MRESGETGVGDLRIGEVQREDTGVGQSGELPEFDVGALLVQSQLALLQFAVRESERFERGALEESQGGSGGDRGVSQINPFQRLQVRQPADERIIDRRVSEREPDEEAEWLEPTESTAREPGAVEHQDHIGDLADTGQDVGANHALVGDVSGVEVDGDAGRVAVLCGNADDPDAEIRE